jgi:wyosine [tRNA(Phe)-imidazoG37] synthetase (radical SAM superfamily)
MTVSTATQPHPETDHLAKAHRPPARQRPVAETAFGCPRDFLGNRFIYTVVSPRARGLSIGVNMNPNKYCDFDCGYCEVNRATPAREQHLEVEVMASELERTLELVSSGQIRERPAYGTLPDEVLQLRHVALSGDGEPTRCPIFVEAVHAVMHVRALGRFPFFKVVLITNSTGLDLPAVQEGLKYFTQRDEIWAKLDAGTQGYMNRINRPNCSIDKVLANILLVGRQRPVIIQSLFTSVNGEEPAEAEIDHYAERLRLLREHGAQIAFVQIYSATRPIPHPECGHLPLKTLSRIAQRVKEVTGLEAEVF